MIHAIYHLILAGMRLITTLAQIQDRLPHYFGLTPAQLLSLLRAGK